MVSLPFELLEDILCRLPVKPLKRFRCVSKTWRSLIDSETFVKLHLRRSLEMNSHRRLIVRDDKSQIFSVDLDDDVLGNAKASVIKQPLSIYAGVISNSCNGLFLVTDDTSIMIWNPFTTESRKLPRVKDDSPVPFGCYSSIVCGLVWDSRNDDYKVVRVEQHRVLIINTVIASRAHIYGLKSNSWRQIGNFTYPVGHWRTAVNGAMHTLVFDTASDSQMPGSLNIMAFSVESETHYEVHSPPLGDIWKSGVMGMSLEKLGGCLSVGHISKSGIAIWAMKEYGVSASWTKMFSIPMMIGQLADSAMKPLVYTKDGYKVLVWFGYNTFFELDLRNQTVDSVPLEGLPYMIDYVDACFESLVSVHSKQVHTQGNGRDKKKDKKRIKKKRDGFRVSRFKLVRADNIRQM